MTKNGPSRLGHPVGFSGGGARRAAECLGDRGGIGVLAEVDDLAGALMQLAFDRLGLTEFNSLIVSFGLLIIIVQLASNVWSADFQRMDSVVNPYATEAVTIGPLAFPVPTLLAFVVTDAPIAAADLDGVATHATQDSFNCISVDGHTSTNDSLIFLANGAGSHLIFLGASAFHRTRIAMVKRPIRAASCATSWLGTMDRQKASGNDKMFSRPLRRGVSSSMM